NLAHTMQIAEDFDGCAQEVMASVANVQSIPTDPIDLDTNQMEEWNPNRKTSQRMPKTKVQKDMIYYICFEKGYLQCNYLVEAYFWKNSGKRVGRCKSHTGSNQTNCYRSPHSRNHTRY